MNEQDIELYHYMLNIELKRFLNKITFPNRSNNKFSDFIIKEFKRLRRERKISLSGLKHFYNAFSPDKNGFEVRWNQRLNRYRDIYHHNSKLHGQTPFERLNGFLLDLVRYQFVIKTEHEDEIEFSASESPNVLSLGFVGIHKDQMHNLLFKRKEIILTYYIGDSGTKGESILLYLLQNYGFNIVLEQQRSQIRLAHGIFAYVFIESFHENLSYCVGGH
ncbi:hypothetical protein L2744_03440 [Shewanella profunda]|uniref:hypothetical protein n=1 Tax=Shewanella profunda TaxID=254793 RepID=UPI00200D6374|nr:hypothetical protein [Shewanella profunda]MCL1088677.1 hypothetical protein [Shewanella profunda]